MKSIEQAIEEQLKTMLTNWQTGKTEFGDISLNLIRKDCGIGWLEAYDAHVNADINTAIKNLCKKYDVKYDKKNGRFLQP